MDSGGSTFRVGTATMPTLAILLYELRSLATSWLVRLWFIGTLVLTFLTVASSWANLQSPMLVAALLFPFLVFPWFLVVMLLGISPVTGTRLEALADGILSRPVTRYEYLLAAWAARVAVVLTVFFLIVLPAVWIVAVAKRPVPEDSVTFYGITAAVSVVALVLTFLVSLGFFVGTLLRRPMLSAVVLIFAWIPINLVLHTFSLEEFSPISLNQSLPTLLRTPWRPTETSSEAGVSEKDLQAAADQAARFLSVLSGGPAPASRQQPNFYERGDYEDFSLLRVILGYGIPTLAAVGLATLCFCWRDL